VVAGGVPAFRHRTSAVPPAVGIVTVQGALGRRPCTRFPGKLRESCAPGPAQASQFFRSKGE